MRAPSHARTTPCAMLQSLILEFVMIATFLRNQEAGRLRSYGCAPHCNMKIISRTEAGVQMNYKVTKGLKKTQRQKAAAKRKSAIIGSDVYSLQACDDRDDDEDELELIEDGSHIEDASFTEDGSFIEDASFIADDSSVDTKDSFVEYAVNRFTKTCQEFTKAIETFEESAVIKCKETADVIVDAANWKFPKATSYTTATNVTGATDVTGCIIYPVVTEEHPAVEVSYNSQAVTCRTLEPQVQKKDEAFSTRVFY